MLEGHLGVRLLQRTMRRVTVTPEGRDYDEKTARILADLEEIDTAFKVARGRPRGHLRIDVGSSTARDVPIPALPDFLARYPEIHIDLGVSDRLVDLIGASVDRLIAYVSTQNGQALPLRFERAGERIELRFEHQVASTRAMPTWRPPGFPFHVVYPQNRHLTHRLRVFIDWLGETFPARLNPSAWARMKRQSTYRRLP